MFSQHALCFVCGLRKIICKLEHVPITILFYSNLLGGWARIPSCDSLLFWACNASICQKEERYSAVLESTLRRIKLDSTYVVLGAALIKSSLAIVQNKKSSACFPPKTVAWGPETTPRRVADASPLLADFVNLLLFYITQNRPPLALNACHSYVMLAILASQSHRGNLPRATVKPESRVSGSPR